MSIRNDRWIIEQSTPPKYVVTEVQLDSSNYDATSLRVKEVQRLSHQSSDQLQTLVLERQNRCAAIHSEFANGVKSFREVTPEDLAGWQPMIDDFTGRQVRETERDGTDEELQFMRANGGTALAKRVGTTVDRLRVDPVLGLQIRQRVISYGVSSFGYDVRIGREFMIFHNALNAMVDPKDFDERSFMHYEGDVCIIPPNSFVLARSHEYFRMPKNVSGLVLGKSTYARCGINCLATPLEPGWEGHITLEYANTTPLPAKLYAMEGAAQVQFFEGEAPMISYADRGGKYQGQRGITLPKA